MTEDFLQFIWEQRLFDANGLKTTDGENIEVVESGFRNYDSGPDFFNARVKIDGTLWVGNIEIHKNASDWLKHNHHHDNAYDSIILHVVDNFDHEIIRKSGSKIPTLVLSYPANLLENYKKLLSARTWIPCQYRFHSIDPFVLKIGFNRLLIERLQEKTADIIERLKQNQYNWNETFYHYLARNFGFKTNSLPFEMLAKSVNLGILGKHKDNLFQLEAILFGQSGLLNQELFGDEYFTGLREEYNFLGKKYGLKPIEGHLWKFLRLRPVNFPTVRIAQFAALIYKSSALFSKIIETPTINQLIELFDVQASAYWDNHYKFNSLSGNVVKHLGDSARNNLIINTVIPFLFVYGDHNNKTFLKDRALEWIDKMPAENNSVIGKWGSLGVRPQSAFETQALLQLKNRYCAEKRCLKCHVGNKIIRM